MAYERGAALRRRRGLYGICAIQGPAEGERNMSRRTRAERILTEATYAAIEREAQLKKKQKEREEIDRMIADVLKPREGQREDERDKL